MTECAACGLSAEEVDGLSPVMLCDRKGRLICMSCLADAVTDMAIGTQQRARYYDRLKEQVPFLNEPPFDD